MMRRKLAAWILVLLMISSCAPSGQSSTGASGGSDASVEASSGSSSLEGSQSSSEPSGGESTVPGENITFEDALGRSLTVSRPKRVAALIGSFADVWVLAGGRDTLVAAASDAWTSFDLDLTESVADLGAVKEPSLEILLSVEPDFVLLSTNTQADLDLLPILESADIPAACFDIQTLEDYLGMLKICTELTGCPENYETYGTEVQEQAEKAIARQDGSAPTVLCLRATGSSCKVKGSEDFVLGEMLKDLGCVNVADSRESLLENLSLEAIMEADPDYIFAVLQGSDDTAARETLETTLLSNPAWQSLRAVKEGRFFTMEHRLYNLKPNARWGESYEKLAEILYPAS